jgi:hypothetical protein
MSEIAYPKADFSRRAARLMVTQNLRNPTFKKLESFDKKETPALESLKLLSVTKNTSA